MWAAWNANKGAERMPSRESDVLVQCFADNSLYHTMSNFSQSKILRLKNLWQTLDGRFTVGTYIIYCCRPCISMRGSYVYLSAIISTTAQFKGKLLPQNDYFLPKNADYKSTRTLTQYSAAYSL